MHGRKKKDIVPLSEEKIKEQEALNERIGKQLQEFFSYRKDTSKLTDPLEYTSVMIKICPEIQTIYNLRKEIIEKRLENMSSKEKHGSLLKELMFLMPLMKQNPKSYNLWHHRKWCFVKGLEIEKEDPTIEKALAKQELALCEMQLAKDERNFHVWNYRSWIINTLKSMDQNVIDQELKFIDGKLQSNFSNFSALHFKSKNLLAKYSLMLQDNGNKTLSQLEDKNLFKDVLLYGIPLQTIKDELEQVKTGLYMQSGEQSMWLYHQWLIDVITPIKIKCARILSKSEQNITIGILLNQKVKGLSEKNIQVYESDALESKQLQVTVQSLGTGRYTNAYKLTVSLQNSTDKLAIRLLNPDQILDNNAEAPLNTVLEYCTATSFEKRLVSDSTFIVELKGDNCTYYAKEDNGAREKELSGLINEQKTVIQEILELEPNNRFAHSQLICVIQTHEEPYANTKEAFSKRLELNERIVKSSENLLKHNQGMANRFMYFLKLYQLKSKILENLKNDNLEKVKEIEQSEEARSLNLNELADLLLLSGVKVSDNEVSSLLNLF